MTQLERVSASKINTWMTCALQARFRYIDKLPGGPVNSSATFGVCIHYALDIYNQDDDIDKAVAAFLDVWRHPEKLNVAPEVWTKGTTYGQLKDRGLAMLRGYHEKIKWNTREVVATEHSFEVPFGPFVLNGFVDLIDLRKDDHGRPFVAITDYKTNKKQPYLNTLPYDVQFTTYVYAAQQPEFWVDLPGMWERVQDLPVRAFWFQLQTSKEIPVGDRGDDDFMRLYRACSEMQRAYEHEVYVPNLSGDSCTFCPYKEPCGLPIPIPEGEVSD